MARGAVFLIAGASVAALKLPLLAMNIAIALLLLPRIYRGEVGLNPWLALVATLFFVLPAPGTVDAASSRRTAANVEPRSYMSSCCG